MTVRPLLLLPFVLLAALAGYAVGAFVTARTIDREPPAGPGEGVAAQAALAALRAQRGRAPDEAAAQAAAREAFLARWPDSWLRARWAAGRR